MTLFILTFDRLLTYIIHIHRYTWKIESSTSTSSGPSADHTTGSASGKFALVEGSTGSLFSSAIYDTPVLGATSVTCVLTFWYHGLGDGYVDVSNIKSVLLVMLVGYD